MSGTLWDTYGKRYDKEGRPVLVWRVSRASMRFNPHLPWEVIDEAIELDPGNDEHVGDE